ncbi:transcription factor bHLH53-like [Phragmites australis]|uniref:transcription factor bHLH53-like n=1 Tax=Phragmites australis TaxID=29695 RepID=UPI002D779CC9|nr:transcription factor bHLH53-like [Phragmites australis]
MALSFHPTTAATLLGHLPAPDAADMSFLQDVHPEVTDALLGFVYDPLDPANAALDDFLNPLPDHDTDAFLGPIEDDGDAEEERHCAKKPRAGSDDAWYGVVDSNPGQHWNGGGNQQVPEVLTEFVLPLSPPAPPQPLAFVRGADAKKTSGNGCQSVQSTTARERRKRISEKTGELSRLIPGGHKLNTAEMLQEAARHVKLLQAQVGMLALMHTIGSTEKEKMPLLAVAQGQMHALLGCGSVQERLAAEGKCLVPRKLVDAVAKDNAVKSNALVNRDLGRFMASLEQ